MSRGIFKKDRMKFALHLVHKIYPKQIGDQEWNVFLGNALSSLKREEEISPWIPDHSKQKIHTIQVRKLIIVLFKILKKSRMSNNTF